MKVKKWVGTVMLLMTSVLLICDIGLNQIFGPDLSSLVFFGLFGVAFIGTGAFIALEGED